jgi:Fe2+ or Zn2+ uptake regulation protein
MPTKRVVIDYAVLKQRLDEYVEQEHMRRSQVRDMVLQAICQLPQPFSASELTEKVAEQRVSTASVYNIIRLFVKARILQCVSRESTREHARYEVLTGDARIITIKCWRCGREKQITSQPITNAIKAYRIPNFNIKRYTLFLYGECKVCRSYKRLF